MAPCRVCAMLAITAGVDRVVAAFAYPGDPDGAGVNIIGQAGIEYKQLSGTILYDA